MDAGLAGVSTRTGHAHRRSGTRLGALIGLGTSPVRTILCFRLPGTGSGIADSSATVYGCNGLSYRSRAGATSTTFPVSGNGALKDPSASLATH